MPDTHFDTDSTPSKTAPAIRAYLGGSFDPVHNSHLQMAMAVYHHLLPIAEHQRRALHVSLLPNARSPFKQQSTNPAHRLAMLHLAIQNTPLQIDELELWQSPPVYSIDSVRTLRARYPNDSLIFIMGMDSARSLGQWKEGLQLTDYVHLWIFSRTDTLTINSSDDTPQFPFINESMTPQKLSNQDATTLGTELPIALQAKITNNPLDLTPSLNDPFSNEKPLKMRHPLKNNAQGRIYIDQRQVSAVSSTQIRQQLRKPRQTAATRAHIVPNNVTTLLNPTVYQYIIAHQLYSAAQFR